MANCERGRTILGELKFSHEMHLYISLKKEEEEEEGRANI